MRRGQTFAGRQKQHLIAHNRLVHRCALLLPIGQQFGERARIHHRPRQRVRANLCAFFQQHDRNILLLRGRQLLDVNGRCQPGRAAAHHHHVVFHRFAGAVQQGVLGFVGRGRIHRRFKKKSGTVRVSRIGQTPRAACSKDYRCKACQGGGRGKPAPNGWCAYLVVRGKRKRRHCAGAFNPEGRRGCARVFVTQPLLCEAGFMVSRQVRTMPESTRPRLCSTHHMVRVLALFVHLAVTLCVCGRA